MSGVRIVWLTRGRRAGTFQEFPAGQARAIVEAGMGQDIKGRAAHQLAVARLTDEAYPSAVVPSPPAAPAVTEAPPEPETRSRQLSAEGKPRKPGIRGAPGKGRYARRDLRAEE